MWPCQVQVPLLGCPAASTQMLAGEQDRGRQRDCHGANLPVDIFIRHCQGLQDWDLLSGPLAHDHVPNFMDSAYTFHKYFLKPSTVHGVNETQPWGKSD